MTTLMERLLQWLAGLGCPVVLLSATLPSERRRKLIEAYTGCSCTIPEDSYPRITVAKRAASDVESHPVQTDDARRLSINVSWIVDDDELIVRLREVLAGGGCVGIVCNTVSRSQELYRTHVVPRTTAPLRQIPVLRPTRSEVSRRLPVCQSRPDPRKRDLPVIAFQLTAMKRVGPFDDFVDPCRRQAGVTFRVVIAVAEAFDQIAHQLRAIVNRQRQNLFPQQFEPHCLAVLFKTGQ